MIVKIANRLISSDEEPEIVFSNPKKQNKKKCSIVSTKDLSQTQILDLLSWPVNHLCKTASGSELILARKKSLIAWYHDTVEIAR